MIRLAFRIFTTCVMEQMNVIKVAKDHKASVKLALAEFLMGCLTSCRTEETNDRWQVAMPTERPTSPTSSRLPRAVAESESQTAGKAMTFQQ